MPLYDYVCDNCKRSTIDIYHPMSFTGTVICQACGAEMHKIPAVSRARAPEFHTPIEMYSVALNDDGEIAAFKQHAPDVDVATDPADPMYGIPIARTRHQKLQALKAVGFTEKS